MQNQRQRRLNLFYVILTGIVIVVLILALGIGSSNNQIPQGESPVEVHEYPVVIPSTTKNLTSETIDKLDSVSPDGNTLTFHQTTSELEDVAIGDIIVSDVSDKVPYGFLKRVVNIFRTNDQVVIQTVQASLDEAIQDGTIKFQKKLTPADLERVEILRAGHPKLAAPTKLEDSLYLKQDDIVIYDEDKDNNTQLDQVRLNLEYEFSPTITFDHSFHGFKPEQILFEIEIEQVQKVEFEYGLQQNLNDVDGSDISKEIAKYYFHPITVYVGIPIVLVPVISVVVGLDGDVHAGVQMALTRSETSKTGLYYDEEVGVIKISKQKNDFGFSPPSLIPDVGWKLQGYVGPRVTLLLYGAVGPYSSLRFYLQWDNNGFGKSEWYAGLGVDVGVKLDVLSRKIFDASRQFIAYHILLNPSNTSETSNTPTTAFTTPTSVFITPNVLVTLVTPLSTTSNSSTAMLFDVSGSMGEQDVTGITKMEAAKDSGERILDIIKAENSVSQGAEVGILSFSDSAWVNASPSASVDAARSALLGLYPLSGTGMPDGLRLAIDQLSGTQNSKPIIIMLSDGLPNIALGSSGFTGDPVLARQQSLDLASEAGAKGICIYTVGFGVPNTAGNLGSYASIDEDFLKQVAANSGCGAYYNAQDAIQLANVYVGLRHESTGNVLLSQTGNIAQDETVDIANVQVPDNQSMILYTLNWPGSQLDAVLTDPGGTVVDANYPNASFSTSDTLASIIIQAPQAGEWKVAAKGVDVPEGSTVYNAVMSVRPNPNPPTPIPVETPPATIPPNPGFPVVILMLVLAGGGVAIYVMVQTRGKGRTNVLASASAAQLIGIGGELTGQAIILRDGMVAGRGSGSSLKLKDRAISRQHVKIRFANGQWFVQDMSSQTGVFVNGVKVQATVLKHGDRIRIGPYEFEFRTTR